MKTKEYSLRKSRLNLNITINKFKYNKNTILKTNIIDNEEHRLENLEPEPEPGEPRLEILEA
jgi:hypothetical protein